MIFVTGPLYSGKRTFVKNRFGWTDEALSRNAVMDAQSLAASAEDLEALAAALAEYPAVISVEIGGGVVPADRE